MISAKFLRDSLADAIPNDYQNDQSPDLIH